MKKRCILFCPVTIRIISNVLTHFGLCNPKQYDTTHVHVLVHVEWGVNTIYSDYIIQIYSVQRQNAKFLTEPNTVLIKNTLSKSHSDNREMSSFLSFIYISPSYSNLNLFQWVWISSKRMGVLFLIFNAIAPAHGNP